MPKTYYLRNMSMQSLPKFSSKIKNIQVENGQYVSVLFILPAMLDHGFEIFNFRNAWKCWFSSCHKEYIWVIMYN